MASSILSKPYPSRPLLHPPPYSLHRLCCLSPSSCPRFIHLSSARSFATTGSALLSSASTSQGSPPAAPVTTAWDCNLRPAFDSDVDYRPQNEASQQFSPSTLTQEPRLDTSLNAVQEETLNKRSDGQAEREIVLSSCQDASADGFKFREPTEYDFEIYASNSMEGFVQPPPPLPRFGAVFEDYWGEVIGEDTRPKGDEASIRIRNGLLKYLESLKEAEVKEKKTKSRPLFPGSRASNQARPIQSYSDYLASKERADSKLPHPIELASRRSEGVRMTDKDRSGAEKSTKNVAASGPTLPVVIEDAKLAEGTGDTDGLGKLPKSVVDDSRIAESGALLRVTDADSVVDANSTEKNTKLDDRITSPGYSDRDAQRPGTDNMLRDNRSSTQGILARDTTRGQSDRKFATSNLLHSVPQAGMSPDRNSAFSTNRPVESSRRKDFVKEEVCNATAPPVITNIGAESMGSMLDTESVGNTSTGKPWERAVDSEVVENRWSGEKVGDGKSAMKPVEDRWPRERFEDVESAGKPVEDNWPGDRFGDAKPVDKHVEEGWADDSFEGVKPADKRVEDRRSGDSFGAAKLADLSLEGRLTGDRFRDVKPTGDTEGGNLGPSFGKSSLTESRPLETISNMVREPIEVVIDSKGTDRLIGTKQIGWEMDSVSTARLLDGNSVDSSTPSKPGELEGNLDSTSDIPGRPMMHADPQVSTNALSNSMEAMRHSSEEDRGFYVPRVGDIVLGAVTSGIDDKLELEIGAKQPGLMLSKELRPFFDPNLENSFFELPSIDENQKFDGFVAPLGKSLIVGHRMAFNGTVSSSPIVGFGTVVTAEVQGLILGDGRAILSARPPARRMAWRRIKQLMQLGEAVNIQIVQYNDGGLLGFLEGVRAFLPRSELLQRPDDTAALSKYVGRTLPVVILQAEEETRNMITSEFMAWKKKNLQLGTVHDATVTRVYPYGMQVQINNTRLRGFVHISNISKEFVKEVADLFTEGDKVKVLLIRGRDAHQVSFSIGELESDKGLIFRNKERVFLEAEEMAKQFREKLSEDDCRIFGQPVLGFQVELEDPGIANMNWLHLSNEVQS